MSKLAATYADEEFVQTVSAQIHWSHNIVILDKVKDADVHEWYIRKPEHKIPRTYIPSADA